MQKFYINNAFIVLRCIALSLSCWILGDYRVCERELPLEDKYFTVARNLGAVLLMWRTVSNFLILLFLR